MPPAHHPGPLLGTGGPVGMGQQRKEDREGGSPDLILVLALMTRSH